MTFLFPSYTALFVPIGKAFDDFWIFRKGSLNGYPNTTRGMSNFSIIVTIWTRRLVHGLETFIQNEPGMGRGPTWHLPPNCVVKQCIDSTAAAALRLRFSVLLVVGVTATADGAVAFNLTSLFLLAVLVVPQSEGEPNR